MSFVENIATAILYRDYFKSDERISKAEAAYKILDGGTVDIKDEHLAAVRNSIDDERLEAVMKKSKEMKKYLAAIESQEELKDC
ncbi:hypothetical protein [Halomonas smyrnensis]|uniref:hypothetical protein n=1 Tax=Halomonas smyrnensis TaxID=720605 RepID=UPI0012E9F5AA|nr:hypothetical protein [Halomonas smyrnensis]